MMNTRVCLVIIVITVVLLASSSGNPHRRRKSKRRKTCDSFKQFRNETSGLCQDCTICTAGSGALHPCKAFDEHSDTVCELCLEGSTYSSGRSHFGAPCYTCTRCGGREIVKACTPTSDTVCGECPLGTYWDGTWGQCRKCSYCFGDSASRSLYLTSACIKDQIPSTHWCARLSNPPYHAPKLYSQVLSNGTTVFYTDLDENIPDIASSKFDKDALAYEEFLEYTSISDPGSDEDDDGDDDDDDSTEEQGWLDRIVLDTDDILFTEALKTVTHEPTTDEVITCSWSPTMPVIFILFVIITCAVVVVVACVVMYYRKRRQSSAQYEPLAKDYGNKQSPRTCRHDDEPLVC